MESGKLKMCLTHFQLAVSVTDKERAEMVHRWIQFRRRKWTKLQRVRVDSVTSAAADDEYVKLKPTGGTFTHPLIFAV